MYLNRQTYFYLSVKSNCNGSINMVIPGVCLLFQYRRLEYSTGLSHGVGLRGSGPLIQLFSSTVLKCRVSNTNSWRSRCSSDQLIDSRNGHKPSKHTFTENGFPGIS